MAQTTKHIQLVADGLDPKADIMNAQIIKSDGTVFDPAAAMVADGSITEAKLATDSVTETKIKDGSVSRLKLTADCVGEGNILPDSIATNMVKDGAITAAKMAAGVIPTIPGAATRTTLGTVKMAATLTPASKAAADTYTKAELDAVVDKLNNLIAQLKAAGIMANA